MGMAAALRTRRDSAVNSRGCPLCPSNVNKCEIATPSTETGTIAPRSICETGRRLLGKHKNTSRGEAVQIKIANAVASSKLGGFALFQLIKIGSVLDAMSRLVELVIPSDPTILIPDTTRSTSEEGRLSNPEPIDLADSASESKIDAIDSNSIFDIDLISMPPIRE